MLDSKGNLETFLGIVLYLFCFVNCPVWGIAYIGTRVNNRLCMLRIYCIVSVRLHTFHAMLLCYTLRVTQLKIQMWIPRIHVQHEYLILEIFEIHMPSTGFFSRILLHVSIYVNCIECLRPYFLYQYTYDFYLLIDWIWF